AVPAATRTMTIASGPYATDDSASRESAASPSRAVSRCLSAPVEAAMIGQAWGRRLLVDDEHGQEAENDRHGDDDQDHECHALAGCAHRPGRHVLGVRTRSERAE